MVRASFEVGHRHICIGGSVTSHLGKTSSRQCHRTLSRYFCVGGRMLAAYLQQQQGSIGRIGMLCPAWEGRWHPVCSGHMDWCPEDNSAEITAVAGLLCYCPSASLLTRPVISLTFYGINPCLLQTDQAGFCCWQPRSLADIQNDSQQMCAPRREVEACSRSSVGLRRHGELELALWIS